MARVCIYYPQGGRQKMSFVRRARRSIGAWHHNFYVVNGAQAAGNPVYAALIPAVTQPVTVAGLSLDFTGIDITQAWAFNWGVLITRSGNSTLSTPFAQDVLAADFWCLGAEHNSTTTGFCVH